MDLTSEHGKAGKQGAIPVEAPSDFQSLLNDLKAELLEARQEILKDNEIPQDLTEVQAHGFAHKANQVMDDVVYVLENQLGMKNGVVINKTRGASETINSSELKSLNNFFLQCQGHFESVRDHLYQGSKLIEKNNNIEHRANIVTSMIAQKLSPELKNEGQTIEGAKVLEFRSLTQG